jgi:multidrug transporter EmrE-like cation transporter
LSCGLARAGRGGANGSILCSLGPARHGRIFLHDAIREARRAVERGLDLHGDGGKREFAIAIVALRGELKPLLFELEQPPLLWATAGGIALSIAVLSLFHALSLGPANVVVPIYGMFIVGGSLLGILFLGEPMAWHKIAGLAAAVIGIVLIAL